MLRIVFFNDNGFGPRPSDGLAAEPWRGAKATTTVLGYAEAEVPADRPGYDLRPTIGGRLGPRVDIVGRSANVRVLDPQNLPPTPKTDAYFVRAPRSPRYR